MSARQICGVWVSSGGSAGDYSRSTARLARLRVQLADYRLPADLCRSGEGGVSASVPGHDQHTAVQVDKSPAFIRA